MGQTHRDGLPVQRIKSELKKTTDPDEVHLEEKLAAGDSSSSRKSNATSLKMLLEKEMSKELESKRKPPSVVARLMGLEDYLPAKEPVLHHAKSDFRQSQSCNQLKATDKALHQQEQHHSIKSVASYDETVEYNDVYEVCEEKSRMRFLHDQTLQKGRSSENKSDTMDIVREKFMEAKRFATEENLLHSKELQEAFEVLPAKEPVLHHAKSDFRQSQSCNQLKATNKALHQQEQHHSIKSVASYDETVEYNDVYEVCEEKSRMRFLHDQTLQKGRSSENKSDTMDIVREKFMEAKRFATEENLLHSKELQEAFEVLSSNKDLFLKFLEEPNCIFPSQLSGFHTNPALPQTKHITVLKPIRSVDNNGVRKSRTERVNEQNGLGMRMFHQRSGSKEEIPSQPSRIVLLRPTPGKPSITKAKLTPRATPFRLIDRNDFNRALDDNEATLGSTGVVHRIIQHRQDGYHRRDESLSSAYSNRYGGDESSFSDSEIDHNSDSEIDYIEEDGGSFSDLEGGSPVLKRSWDYLKRYESPYSGSSFSKISHFPESSVIREAKKRLSERLAMVTRDEIGQEKVQLPRSTCTLGEMLSLREVKIEDFITGVLSVSSNRSCGTENELTTQATYVTTCRKDDEDGDRSPRKLPRSKSVPVISSTFDNMVANVQSSNCEGCKPTKVVVMSNKGQSYFKGRVSDFFFSRSKMSTKQKSTTHHSSDCFDERVEACVGDSQTDANHNLDTNEIAALSNSTSEGTASIDVHISLDCPSRNLDKLGLNDGLNCTRDQPSPTSVLDAPSEDSSCNEPESSGSTASKNSKAVSRSSAIEDVARSLSWDDTTPESPLLGTPRLPSLFSDLDDDESECHVLVQNIMSSAGLDNAQSSMVFTGWQLPDCPLDPVLCNKVLELRERRSYQRLLFDCVNVALIEIGENALLSTFPWSKAHSRAWRDTSSPALGVEVWSILKDWIYGARMFVVSKGDNAGIMMDRIVKQEVEGRGWVTMMRSQMVDITEQIEGGVLEELVREAVLDFADYFRQ